VETPKCTFEVCPGELWKRRFVTGFHPVEPSLVVRCHSKTMDDPRVRLF
jgi:hypothetical protein